MLDVTNILWLLVMHRELCEKLTSHPVEKKDTGQMNIDGPTLKENGSSGVEDPPAPESVPSRKSSWREAYHPQGLAE